MPKEAIKRRMPDYIKAINTADPLKVTRYENIILCMFISPLLLFGAFANTMRYFVLDAALQDTIINVSIFLLLAISFELVTRISIDTKLQTYLVSALLVLINIFAAVRVYAVVGHAYWLIIALLIIMSMFRLTKVTLIIVLVTSCFTCAYIWYTYPMLTFETGPIYYVPLTVLLIFLFSVAFVVHEITVERYREINKKYREAHKQKQEITALYEELATTEEELRENNEQLFQSNRQIKANEEALRHLAYFDPLTELPNRKMIMEQIKDLISIAGENNHSLYIVLLDLDNFKKINDSIGHFMGDLLLQAVSERLKRQIDQRDLLGHIGGDEFAIIIDRNISEEEVHDYVESLRKCLLNPFSINNSLLRTSASFGISVYPKDGKITSELIQSADTSMYKAKDLGRNTVNFFRKSMLDEIIQKTELENKLICALQNEEFYLVYQPQYSLPNQKIVGFEALLRWQSPELGLVSPGQFIPLAEETGVIFPLGEWVLQTACAQIKELQEKYGLEIYVSVNISAVQLKDRLILDKISKILGESKLKPQHLHLEITESVFLEYIYYAVELMNELKKIGLKIDLDDFGTGYSSLSYLKLLPIDTLKIDRTFIKDLAWNAPNKHIVGDIISLAHNLNVQVIAEGVEFDHQLTYLKNADCDCVQGFLLGKPMKAADLDMLFSI